ncbi:hypothetical protein SAMD00019534_070430 [Acytostelium subglobosum LB1]|uniref:hypothetical protein n=1 Tax=Acytostelium subglobosum LB1 TaxID=1410327 RepID=UPI00064495DA|nr:hypothetical protein SAMD00019534_070430 [Acytostelium subglobosum LB1]GAM23868.1 hypothetical protein SAMD00019534_070430 [Acytostelium subglobosum LB1]|eukprot:XP_012752904.1 hypothetical protein SAMD00019534_070430 [Acytostelium subglobosum LB1]
MDNNNHDHKEIEEEWKRIQNELKQRHCETDRVDFIIPGTSELPQTQPDSDANSTITTSTATTTTSTSTTQSTTETTTTTQQQRPLRYVAGVDISFVKDNVEDACASIVILELPGLKVIHEEMMFVKLDLPYIPGFLAFRECPSLIHLIEKVRTERPEIFPQVILVDGNGLLHPRAFGLACQLGVLTDLPTIGIGKTFFCVDGMLTKQVKADVAATCKQGGDHLLLRGDSGKVWGAAVISHSNSTNAIFVSIGHRLSLDSCLKVVAACTTTNRIPEPVRQADLRSRDFIRINYKPTAVAGEASASTTIADAAVDD